MAKKTESVDSAAKTKNLVIVESPAKAKTIKKFLGNNYKIEASMGHVRDLPKSQMGVDIENDFEPKYINKIIKTNKNAQLNKRPILPNKATKIPAKPELKLVIHNVKIEKIKAPQKFKDQPINILSLTLVISL